ncbi:sulfotransferase 1 family member D1-like [Wyeomyia smithii]|uniref:sulfotransferase 1 family member D1-like n=1 Tax=Wyeomyia smithii TaxID=174621 RepID=UPI0024681011|nr:sulfotransferase 1 family member D1-like [Wyeomyia smithii]
MIRQFALSKNIESLPGSSNRSELYQVATMSVNYIEITDPVYRTSWKKRNEHGYVLVEPKEHWRIPIREPGWKPKPCCLTKRFEKFDDEFSAMEVRSDDVWLASYPKTGTTWSQEMVWLICNNLDFETARKESLFMRFPFVELNGIADLPGGFDYFKIAQDMPSPRFIKTHLPVGLLPHQIWSVKPKLVYVYRKAKSVAVSFYHHMATIANYKGTLEEFTRSFMRDLQLYSPYHDHVIDYHKISHLDNLLLINYEEMKTDLPAVIKRVCVFFNKSYTDEQLAELCNHLSFESMRNNPSLNANEMVDMILTGTGRAHERDHANRQFIRKGQVDGWKSDLTPELAEEIDNWTRAKVPDVKYQKLFL